jgi:hypothetical protein
MAPTAAVSSEKGSDISVSGQVTPDEKTAVNVVSGEKNDKAGEEDTSIESDRSSDDVIIVTGADAAAHLIPLRDDFDPVLTFRSIILASGLACFQAVMNQIYQVSVRLIPNVCRVTNTRPVFSLNRLLLPSRELLLFSFPTLLAMHGLNYSRAATNSNRSGGLKTAKENCRNGFCFSSLLILVLGR